MRCAESCPGYILICHSPNVMFQHQSSTSYWRREVKLCNNPHGGGTLVPRQGINLYTNLPRTDVRPFHGPYNSRANALDLEFKPSPPEYLQLINHGKCRSAAAISETDRVSCIVCEDAIFLTGAGHLNRRPSFFFLFSHLLLFSTECSDESRIHCVMFYSNLSFFSSCSLLDYTVNFAFMIYPFVV